MKTSILNIKTDPETKEQLKAFATNLGLPVSALLNAQIKQMLRTGKVEFEKTLEPTPYLEKLIKEAEDLLPRRLMALTGPRAGGTMSERDRQSERNVGRSENDVSRSTETARDGRFQADDRGGSRDGERLEPGDAGDREQLDNDGGRTPSRR